MTSVARNFSKSILNLLKIFFLRQIPLKIALKLNCAAQKVVSSGWHELDERLYCTVEPQVMSNCPLRKNLFMNKFCEHKT